MTERILFTTREHSAAELDHAARVLRSGGLVAFPTETVYGLGASALDPEAVARIYAAKGRPASNPVIVHVASIAAARELTSDWPDTATQLAERFWPGPLTLVLPKQASIPDMVTAGGMTVAVRIPAHPAALALLEVAGIPLAAPSANRSMNVSPTTADHVLDELDGRINLILDGGPTQVGIESTVLDLTTPVPKLLRPGMITHAELEAFLGPVDRASSLAKPSPATAELEISRSPGLMLRHYAPRARLELHSPSASVIRFRQLIAGETSSRQSAPHSNSPYVAWLGRRSDSGDLPKEFDVALALLADEAEGFAAELFAELRRLDRLGVERIVVALPPAGPAWEGIHDRLRRGAASPSENE